MNEDALDSVGRVIHGGKPNSGILDFSANTNPLVPDGVERVYREAFEPARRYPPEPPTAFREAAGEYVGCDPDLVVPTPGGLAAIRLAVQLVVEPGDRVLVEAPSFGEYAREVRLAGGTPEFRPPESILEAAPAEYALAILCTPNNPTGDLIDREVLADFARRCRERGTVLLVDEAFLGFTDQASMAGVDGVVVARSLTKLFGLPGLRAGFLVAPGDIGDRLAVARRPWNLSVPALETGTFCMGRTDFVAATRERVRRERARLLEALAEDFDVRDSRAPFLLVDVGERDVDAVLEAARDRGLALRDARTFRGLDSHVRVAVRLPAENDRLLEVLADV